jgi:hypothetical protein
MPTADGLDETFVLNGKLLWSEVSFDAGFRHWGPRG